ncbi:hypothetical protein BT93_B2766 [Corymbia citriodora subsp. variegata]|nr:hypothetical protein BT93_B2766 [Corymbia citriodora subsp. variegata]
MFVCLFHELPRISKEPPLAQFVVHAGRLFNEFCVEFVFRYKMATPEENNDLKTLETQPNKRRKKNFII